MRDYLRRLFIAVLALLGGCVSPKPFDIDRIPFAERFTPPVEWRALVGELETCLKAKAKVSIDSIRFYSAPRISNMASGYWYDGGYNAYSFFVSHSIVLTPLIRDTLRILRHELTHSLFLIPDVQLRTGPIYHYPRWFNARCNNLDG